MPKLFKITSLLFLCNVLRRKCGEVDFCMQISRKACYKFILWFWWPCSSIPKVPKIASWQFLYNISKEKVRDEVDFLHRDKHQSFNKLALSFLMEVAKLVQSTQNRNSVIFWKYTQKKEWQMLLCSFVMPNIQIFYGVQSCSLFLVFHKVREIFQV